jgi:hypothetical protein
MVFLFAMQSLVRRSTVQYFNKSVKYCALSQKSFRSFLTPGSRSLDRPD